MKAKVLANALYRAVGVEVEVETQQLTGDNARKVLGKSNLVIDAFDNSGSRRVVKGTCEGSGIPCLHAGLAKDYAEVIWNDQYRVSVSGE